MTAISDQERAQRSADAMWENDAASKGLGIVLESVEPGRATLSLKVESKHLNGHGICHGGFIFTLADSAFAFACNSYNRCAVGQSTTASFLQPGRVGSTLVANAEEISVHGRSGIYDVTVVDDEGNTIAVFRGQSRTIQGTHFNEDGT